MKLFKSNLVLGAAVAAATMLATATHANTTQDPLAQAYKSTNVKTALVNVCKTETQKSGKLTSAEVNKYCTCAIEADGKLTNDQKWQIQSAINQKKSPSSLAFVQKQNKELQACFGPQLMTKLKTLTEQAQAAQKK